MVAPETESEIVTAWALLYVPPAGENVGVGAGEAIVYVAVLTEDCVCPDAVAIALIVVVAVTVIGPPYCVEEVVGVVPLTV